VTTTGDAQDSRLIVAGDVAGNTVTGSLYCTGNNPVPSDNGSINIVGGTGTSQCAAIAKR
jgi:hypothetical protein